MLSLAGFSQNPQMKVAVNPNIITPNTVFQVSFIISGGNVSTFQPPSFKGLNILGSMRSSGGGTTIIVNGQIVQGGQSEDKFIYQLSASAAGKYTIEPAKAKVNGVVIQSQSTVIDVVASRPQAKANTNSNNGNGDNSQDIFIKATLNKSNAIVGEQLILIYKLYTRVGVSQYGIEKAPSNKGFWSQNLLKETDPPKQYEEMINGQRYTVAEIRKVSLVPQQSGKLTIEPLKVECLVKEKVKRRNDNFFDNIFNDPFFDNAFSSTQTVKKSIKSNAVTLTIQPLPANNQPSDFTGAVGNFQLTSSIDKTKVSTNDAITLKIKISGNGNLQLIDNPKINFPTDFEAYDPKTSEQITTNEKGMSGSKSYEYVFIPRAPGRFVIPAYNFSYFDLNSKQYKTISTDAFNIEVDKGKNVASSTVVSTNQKDIKYLGSDIRFIKTGNTTLNKKNNLFFLSSYFWILICLPIILFIITTILLRKQMTLKSNNSLLKNKRATKIAKKRLLLAEKSISANNSNEFYIEISKALWGYISDKFNIPQSQLSLENVNDTFRNTKASEDTINDIISLLNEIEYNRFSPLNDDSQNENLYKQCHSLIIKIEKELK